MRVDRWLLDPLRLWPALFALQALVWYVGFPERPTIALAAPRFFSRTAVLRFAILFGCLIAGLLLGHVIAAYRKLHQFAPRPLVQSVKTYQQIAFVGVILAATGELIYTRAFLRDPMLLVRGFLAGDFAAPSSIINSQQITGVSSLNNVYLVPTAIYAMLAFHPRAWQSTRRRFGRRLALLGVFVILHVVVLSARMFAVYFVAIVVAAYLLERPLQSIRVRYVISAAAFLLFLIWASATLRDGGWYVAENGGGYLHPDTQRYVRDTLMQGYFGADFNNALVFLNCAPTKQYVTSTMFATVWRKFGYTFVYPESCYPEDSSLFGTANTLALWWIDLGWYAGVFAILVGAFVSFTYRAARAQTFGFWTTVFLIAYPGVFSSIRINYFALTIFVLPVAYVAATVVFLRLFPEQRIRIKVRPTELSLLTSTDE